MAADTYIDTPDDPGAQDLLAKLQAQTNPQASVGVRPPSFNAPDRWYARPDGDIVKLQGDAASQAYYTSKGFHLLTAAEVRLWEGAGDGGVRRLVIQEQRKRASLITTLRRIANKHPGVELAGDLDITTTEELQGMLEQIGKMTGGTVAVVTGRFRDDTPADAPIDVELRSGDQLRAKLEADQARRAGGRGGKITEFQGQGSDV